MLSRAGGARQDPPAPRERAELYTLSSRPTAIGTTASVKPSREASRLRRDHDQAEQVDENALGKLEAANRSEYAARCGQSWAGAV